MMKYEQLMQLFVARELDTHRTLLWAQVRKAKANHLCEQENHYLRPAKYLVKGNKVILGDIAETIILVFDQHETPVFTTPPRFDEQNWVLVIQDSQIKIEITSRPYWGFGLFSLCYANEILITGSTQRKNRLIYDLLSNLNHQPWTAVRQKKFTRFCGKSKDELQSAWEIHNDVISDKFKEDIKSLEGKIKEYEEGELSPSQKKLFIEGREDIEIAEAALKDNNSFAIERAISRVEEALIEADPEYESEKNALLENSDSNEKALVKILDKDNSNPGGNNEPEDIPLVDLSEELSEDDEIPLVDLSLNYEEE